MRTVCSSVSRSSFQRGGEAQVRTNTIMTAWVYRGDWFLLPCIEFCFPLRKRELSNFCYVLIFIIFIFNVVGIFLGESCVRPRAHVVHEVHIHFKKLTWYLHGACQLLIQPGDRSILFYSVIGLAWGGPSWNTGFTEVLPMLLMQKTFRPPFG